LRPSPRSYPGRIERRQHGQIGKTQVYSKWKGRPYARRYIIPSNPNTTAQQGVRGVFKFLNDLWKYMPGGALAAWELYAQGSQITARNGWLKQNTAALIGETDLANLVFSPSAKSGLQAAAITATAGANQITVALTAPFLPTGWTISQAIAACVLDQDPMSPTDYKVTEGTDASSPYSIVLGSLTTGVLYRVGGWFEFTRPDGTFAYGQSLPASATPT
jgi:hypothetical protein